MIGMTICSGIGAPEMAAPWVDWRFASEIEPFPREVLQQRFNYKMPADHNQGEPILWGDMCEITPELLKDQGVPLPDLIVAGTPCQAFSIAGLRKGVKDDRGNLTLKFVEIVAEITEAALNEGKAPPVILWENVPGIISIKGNPLENLIAAFNSLGFACDIDILDAQFFGVPQRRRRVFLVCQHVETGRKKKLPFFATAGATFLTETFLTVLAEALRQSGSSVSDWRLHARHSVGGQQMRMKLFGLSAINLNRETDQKHLLKNWLKDWVETTLLLQSEQKDLGSTLGPSAHPADILGERLSDGVGVDTAETPSMNTLRLWSESLAAVCEKVNTSTTSTAIKTITPKEIYSCAETLHSIARFIISSTGLPLNYYDEASSLLTALKEFTRYARETSNDLFGDRERIREWRDFEQSASHTISEIERHFGKTERAKEVLSKSKGLQGNTPPSRETGKEATGGAGSGASHWSGGPHPSLNQSHNTGGIGASNQEIFSQQGAGIVEATQEVAGTMLSRKTSGGFSNSIDHAAGGYMAIHHEPASWPAQIAPTLNAAFGDKQGLEDQHALNGAGLFVPVAFDCKGTEVQTDETGVSPPLRAMGHNNSHANAGGHAAVAFDTTQITSKENGSNPQYGDPCHPLAAGAHPPAVAFKPSHYTRGKDGAPSEIMPPLSADADKGDQDPVVFSIMPQNSGKDYKAREVEVSQPLMSGGPVGGNQGGDFIQRGPTIRRLMPLECARLQGFPDDHLDIMFRGKPAADGNKYKAYGNSMAVSNIKWIMDRIREVIK